MTTYQAASRSNHTLHGNHSLKAIDGRVSNQKVGIQYHPSMDKCRCEITHTMSTFTENESALSNTMTHNLWLHWGLCDWLL